MMCNDDGFLQVSDEEEDDPDDMLDDLADEEAGELSLL